MLSLCLHVSISVARYCLTQVEEFQSARCIHGMFAKPGGSCGIGSLEATGRFLKKHCS